MTPLIECTNEPLKKEREKGAERRWEAGKICNALLVYHIQHVTGKSVESEHCR